MRGFGPAVALLTPTFEPSLSVELGTIIPLRMAPILDFRPERQTSIVEMKERTVATQVKTYILFPNAVLIPAGPRSESNALFTALNMADRKARCSEQKYGGEEGGDGSAVNSSWGAASCQEAENWGEESQD